MEELQWILQLQQQISGPATEAARALEQLAKVTGGADHASKELGKNLKQPTDELKKAQKEAKALDVELGKIGKGGVGIDLDKLLTGFAGGGFAGALTFGLADALVEAGEAFVDVLKEGIESVFEVSKEIIKAAAAEEQTELSFKLLVGKDGKKLLEDLEDFSKQTSFTAAQVTKSLIPMIEAGVKNANDLRAIFRMGADVAATHSGGIATVQAVIRELAEVKKRGRLVRPEGLASALNIKADELFKQIGAELHTTPDQVRKLMEQGGKIDFNIIANAVGDIIRRQRGNEQLGAADVEHSTTAEAYFDKLSGLPEEYFKKWGDSQAFTDFKTQLDSILKMLDPSSAEGKQITSAINEMMSQVVGFLKLLSQPDSIKEFTNVIKQLFDIGAQLVSIMPLLVSSFKEILDLIADFIHPGRPNEGAMGARGIEVAKHQKEVGDILKAGGVNLLSENEKQVGLDTALKMGRITKAQYDDFKLPSPYVHPELYKDKPAGEQPPLPPAGGESKPGSQKPTTINLGDIHIGGMSLNHIIEEVKAAQATQIAQIFERLSRMNGN